MPSAADFLDTSIRVLMVGKPGAGKTGSLISILIADPEARFFVCNFDRANFRTLPNVARFDPATGKPRDAALTARLLSQIQVHHFLDPIRLINGKPQVTGAPVAFKGIGDKLNDWGDGYGSMNTWGPKDWLVLDSISAIGEAAMRASTHAMGRLNSRPEQSDWGDAINRCSMLLELTNDPSLACNVAAITHIRFVGDQEAGTDEKGKAREVDMVPNALGQKLPQEIGRFFSDILEIRSVGSGPGTRRAIYTRPPGGLVLRSSNPGSVKPEYNLNTGMAEWVRDIRSVGGVPLPATTPDAPASGATAAPAA